MIFLLLKSGQGSLTVNKYLFSIYEVLGNVLGTEDGSMAKTNQKNPIKFPVLMVLK